MSYGHSYELCHSDYDPTYGSACSCGILTFATCTICGAVVDDQGKHDAWHEAIGGGA